MLDGQRPPTLTDDPDIEVESLAMGVHRARMQLHCTASLFNRAKGPEVHLNAGFQCFTHPSKLDKIVN